MVNHHQDMTQLIFLNLKLFQAFSFGQDLPLNRTIAKFQPIAVNLRICVIDVGAAFQPRSKDCGVRTKAFRGWKAAPTKNSR